MTRGRKLHIFTTIVETDIHHPTESGWIGDGVHVVSRLLRRAQAVLGEATAGRRASFRSRRRSASTLSKQLHRVARRKGEEAEAAVRTLYGRLIAAATRTAAQGLRVLGTLGQAVGAQARRLAARLRTFVPRLAPGIDQARRLVLQGEAVPVQEKLLSLFEPHTQIILRHKAGYEVEFGRKTRLDEVEGGIVTGYQVLRQGGGQDHSYLTDSLDRHRHHFDRASVLLAADRGRSSPGNERLAQQAGVKRVAMPHVSKASAKRQQHEKERWFRRGNHFRAGIERRSHVLRRDYGLGRCSYHGEAGMGRWVGWGQASHNLARIAAAVASR